MIFDFLKREDPGKSLSIQMKNAYLRSHSIFQFFLFFMFIYASRRSGLPLVITWCAASYMAGSAFHLLGRYIINTEKIRSLSVQRHFSVTADEAMEAATGEENKVYLGNGYIWSVECAQAYHELMNQTGVEHIINLEPEGGGKTFLHNIGIGRLLSPDVASIQWGDTIQNRRIVFISLPAMIDDFSTSAVGRLFVGDLVAHIGQLYAYNHVLMPVWLHVEEWYSVAFGKWVDVLNKARAAGVQASLSMQTSADITAALKKEITAQILTNTANKIFLRTPELELANEFSELFGEVMVPKRVVTRSINSALDKTDNLFKSGMSERLDMVPIPLVSPTMLTTLPRGEGFIQTQGFPPIKMRFPLLDTSGVAADSFFNRLNPEVPLSTAELEEEAAEKLMGEQMSLEMEEEGDGSEPDEQPDDPLAGFVGLSEEDFQK